MNEKLNLQPSEKKDGVLLQIYRNPYFRFFLFALFICVFPLLASVGVMPTSFITLLGGVLIYSIVGLGLNLLLETGQETPISLLRLIEDVGTGNIFVNLDPANLMMYGCGNAVDAIDVFGKYVRNVHGKDGCVPTEPRKLGKETVVGEGMVDFRAMLQKLKNLGYDRFITIEREAAVNDTQRQLDAMHAKNYLENIWNSLD